MTKYPAFENLRSAFNRLPGIGRRSAERLVFGLLTDQTGLLTDLTLALKEFSSQLCCCEVCGALTAVDVNPCSLCTDPKRDDSLLCVVEDPVDILRIEQTGGYQGRYHSLMGRLSPAEGLDTQNLRLSELLERVASGDIREVILALNSNLESAATASFIRSRLTGSDIQITRPATGIPSGSGIAYADASTLASALKSRHNF